MPEWRPAPPSGPVVGATDYVSLSEYVRELYPRATVETTMVGDKLTHLAVEPLAQTKLNGLIADLQQRYPGAF